MSQYQLRVKESFVVAFRILYFALIGVRRIEVQSVDLEFKICVLAQG